MNAEQITGGKYRGSRHVASVFGQLVMATRGLGPLEPITNGALVCMVLGLRRPSPNPGG